MFLNITFHSFIYSLIQVFIEYFLYVSVFSAKDSTINRACKISAFCFCLFLLRLTNTRVLFIFCKKQFSFHWFSLIANPCMLFVQLFPLILVNIWNVLRILSMKLSTPNSMKVETASILSSRAYCFHYL